jgi:hypothetical protein
MIVCPLLIAAEEVIKVPVNLECPMVDANLDR